MITALRSPELRYPSAFPWVLLGFGGAAAGLMALAVTLTLLHGTGPWGFPGYYPVFWPLFPLGFFLLFATFFLVLRWRWGGWGWARWGYAACGPLGARETLELRFARGEISPEEFRERLEALQATVHLR